jgi:putative endopeptidase
MEPTTDLSLAAMQEKHAKWFYQKYVRNQFYRLADTAIWDMAVYDVNAYYDLNLNMVVVPAGILQKPFFNYAEASRNFGGLGCIIGHELTHGFDDQGRKYNPEYEMKKWWSTHEIRAYERRAEKVRKYYSEMKFMGHPLNGALTLGENLADIGGLKLSLGALKRLPGRPDYRAFFKAYAILWRELIRPKAVRQSLLENPHSPDGIRINAVLAHIAEFHQTYGRPLSLKAIEQLNEYSIW